MHAYLIVTNDTKKADERISKLAKEKKAQVMPLQISKIEDVRELIKFANLGLSQNTIIAIKNIDKASTEALNAFLKILEEPQKNLTFVLTGAAQQSVLPTIVSRCQVIIGDNSEAPDKDLKFAEKFLSSSAGLKLELISQIKTKDDALIFLEGLISGLHGYLNKDAKNLIQIADNIKNAESALKAIKQNGNTTIHMTNFAVRST